MTLHEDNGKTLISSIAQDPSKVLINHQLLIVPSNRKLNFYNTFKRDTNRTEFLDSIKNPLHRSSINNFCPGNHRLRIETERYTVPKPPDYLRICFLCQANEVENECDVMFSCTLHDTFRNKFFDEIITKYNFFNDLDVKSKFFSHLTILIHLFVNQLLHLFLRSCDFMLLLLFLRSCNFKGGLINQLIITISLRE